MDIWRRTYGKGPFKQCDGSSDQSLMVDPLSYVSFQPMLHGMYYPVCGMMHIKEPLLSIRKSSHYLSGFFTICLMPYNRK